MRNIKLKSWKFIIFLGFPIFISFSVQSTELFFDRNVWSKYPVDTFSLPIGLLIFLFVYKKEFISELKINIKFITYILLLIIYELIMGSFTTRYFIEKINLILFFIVIGIISNVKLDQFELKRLREYSLIISLGTIILWFIHADFDIGRGGRIAFNFNSYNFEQYSAYSVYLIFIVSALYLKLYKLLLVSYILVGELLYQISSSRIIYIFIVMLTIYFLLIFYSGKDYFLIKKNKIMNKIMLNFVSLNIIYIIFIFIFNIDYGRYLLVKETFVEIFNGYTIFPSNFFYEKELLYSSHNQLLEIVRTSGLIGLLYFLWFIDRIFNKSNNMMQLILTIYLYIGIGLFVLPFTHPYSYFVLGLIILITGGFNSSDKNNARN